MADDVFEPTDECDILDMSLFDSFLDYYICDLNKYLNSFYNYVKEGEGTDV